MFQLSKNPRRVIRWEKLKSPRVSTAVALATAWGAGLAPFAPGTAGTLVGVGIHWITADANPIARALLWTALFVAGTWASKVVDEEMGTSDNQNIVMDEVVGLGITAWTAGTHPASVWTAFVLFRLFDVIKIPPVRFIDQWSKKKASEGNSNAQWFGGFGVMADDVGAAIQGLICMLLLQHFGILPS